MKYWMTGLMLATACVWADYEQQFGRLFSTPEQRQVIDQQRQSGPVPVTTTSRVTRQLRFDGLMTQQGRLTAWVNGQPLAQQPRLQRQLNLRVQGQRLFADVPQEGGSVTRQLEAGESLSYRINTRSVSISPKTESQVPTTPPPAASAPVADNRLEARFDETELALQDYRLQLLEERFTRLQAQSDERQAESAPRGIVEPVLIDPRLIYPRVEPVFSDSPVLPDPTGAGGRDSQLDSTGRNTERYFSQPVWTQDRNQNRSQRERAQQNNRRELSAGQADPLQYRQPVLDTR